MALSILGTGVYLPPSRPVRELVEEAGARYIDYNDWENVCVATENDHPSTMGAAALQEALAAAGVEAGDLDYIISTGMTRDYLPSWSLSTEWARLSGASRHCRTLDITSGCAGSLFGLDLMLANFASRGGGYGAVVAAERTSDTIDRGDPGSNKLWGFGDAAGAIIVALNRPGKSRATFNGAEFVNRSELNGTVLIKYGGTRHPVAPPGVNPGKRILQLAEGVELSTEYRAGYTEALSAMKQRFKVDPNYLIVNQISVNMVEMICEVAGVAPENSTRTGNTCGHCGSADAILGLHTMLADGDIHEPVTVAGSTPYVFAAGLITKE